MSTDLDFYALLANNNAEALVQHAVEHFRTQEGAETKQEEEPLQKLKLFLTAAAAEADRLLKESKYIAELDHTLLGDELFRLPAGYFQVKPFLFPPFPFLLSLSLFLSSCSTQEVGTT